MNHGLKWISVTVAAMAMLVACGGEDGSVGRSGQGLSAGIATEGFCTPQHCDAQSISCAPDESGRSRHPTNLRCRPNEQVGSGVGTCTLDADCTLDEADASCQ